MSEPSYLPLLNSIAVNECKGEALLKAWADATPDAQLAGVLRFVSIREGEHSWAFTKRMCELGYEVCEDTAYQVFKDFDGLLACLGSREVSDADKIARFSGATGSGQQSDPFAGFFADKTIDPETGELLGRYICEERDSGRRLQAEFDRICADRTTGTDTSGLLGEVQELKACIEALRNEVAELRNVRSAA